MSRESICEVRTLFANDLPVDKQSLPRQIMRNNLTICSPNIHFRGGELSDRQKFLAAMAKCELTESKKSNC